MSALAALDRLISDLRTHPAFRAARVLSPQELAQAQAQAQAGAGTGAPFVGTVSRLLGLAYPQDHSAGAALTDDTIWLETPDIIQDVAWFPVIPPGHSAFTWGLDDTDLSASTDGYVPASQVCAPVHVHVPVPVASSAPAAVATAAPAEPAATATATATATTKAAATPAAAQKAAAPQNQKKQKQDMPAKDKSEKKSDKPAAAPPAAPNTDLPPIARLDIRVGRIVRAWKHPGADSLYVESIDVGEKEPRQVVSGLVKFIPEEKMQGARCLVICNLKASKLRGETSFGMVLAASNADRSVVELIQPPEAALPGERVTFQGLSIPDHAQTDKEVNPQSKQNAWELAKGDLKTDGDRVAVWKCHRLVTSSGPCQGATLANATVS